MGHAGYVALRNMHAKQHLAYTCTNRFTKRKFACMYIVSRIQVLVDPSRVWLREKDVCMHAKRKNSLLARSKHVAKKSYLCIGVASLGMKLVE